MFCGSAAQNHSEKLRSTPSQKKENYSNSPVGNKCACSSTNHHRSKLTYLITLWASVLTNGSAAVFAKLCYHNVHRYSGYGHLQNIFCNIQHLIEINETLQLKVPPRVLSSLSFLCASAPCYRYARGPKSDPGFQRKCKVKHDHLRCPSYPCPSHNLHHPNVLK